MFTVIFLILFYSSIHYYYFNSLTSLIKNKKIYEDLKINVSYLLTLKTSLFLFVLNIYYISIFIIKGFDLMECKNYFHYYGSAELDQGKISLSSTYYMSYIIMDTILGLVYYFEENSNKPIDMGGYFHHILHTILHLKLIEREYYIESALVGIIHTPTIIYSYNKIFYEYSCINTNNLLYITLYGFTRVFCFLLLIIEMIKYDFTLILLMVIVWSIYTYKFYQMITIQIRKIINLIKMIILGLKDNDKTFRYKNTKFKI